MPHIPDRIVNKTAQGWQTFLYVIACIFGLGGVSALASGNGGGLLALLIAWLTGWIGTKIKTTYHHKGSASDYR